MDANMNALMLDFVNNFNFVFHEDWDYTLQTLTGEAPECYIAPGSTFIRPFVDDESNNWSARGGLLESYRRLIEAMENAGMGPQIKNGPKPPPPIEEVRANLAKHKALLVSRSIKASPSS